MFFPKKQDRLSEQRGNMQPILPRAFLQQPTVVTDVPILAPSGQGGVSFREKILAQVRLPQYFTAFDIRRAFAVTKELQRAVREEVEKAKSRDHTLPLSFLGDIRNLEAGICFLYLSALKNPARDQGMTSLVVELEALTHAGIELHKDLDECIKKTEASDSREKTWEATSLIGEKQNGRSLKDRILPSIKLPEDFEILDIRIAFAAMKELQSVVREEMEKARNNDGLLSSSFLDEIRGLEAELCYLYLSSLKNPARDKGVTALLGELDGTFKSGLKLHQGLMAVIDRTEAVQEFRRAAKAFKASGSGLELLSLLKVMPKFLEIGFQVSSELKALKDQSLALPAGLLALDRELKDGIRAFENPEILTRSIERIDSSAVSLEQIELISRLPSEIEALRRSSVFEKWFEALSPKERQEMTQVIDRFLSDEKLSSALRRDRLHAAHLADHILRQAQQDFRARSAKGVKLEELSADDIVFRELLQGDEKGFVGPLASIIASSAGDWEKLFSTAITPGKDRVFLSRSSSGEVHHIERAILYENDQPRSGIFALWKKSDDTLVPIIVRLDFSSPEYLKTQLEFAFLNEMGKQTAAFPLKLGLQEGRFQSSVFLKEDASEIQIGVLPFRGRTTLTLQDRRGEVVYLNSPLVKSDGSVETLVTQFEDLAGIIPYLSAEFRSFVEADIKRLFCRIADFPIGSVQRQALIERIETSPFPMRGRLLEYLEDVGLTPIQRAFSAHITFRRRYAQWGKIVESQALDSSSWSGLVEEKENDHRRVVAVMHSVNRTDIKEGIREALRALKQQGALWKCEQDGAIDLIIPESNLLPIRLGAIVKGGDLSAQTLEEMITEVLSEESFSDLKDRLWRVTVEVNRGAGEKPLYWTFRNRERYEKDWNIAGYKTTLPGSGAFAHDSVLDGIDPLLGKFHGLNRLGEYSHIEAVPAFDEHAGRVLVLHGEKDTHYYLSSIVPPGEIPGQKNGRLASLLSTHVNLARELGRQLGNKEKWPKNDQVPQWNRLRFYLEGLWSVSPEKFESLMQDFARESLGERDGLFVEKTLIEARLEFLVSGRPVQVTALVSIEDVGPVAKSRVLYLVETSIDGVPQQVLVRREVLEGFLSDPSRTLNPGEWSPADEKIRDRTPLDRRRSAAQKAGSTFIYDRPALFPKEAAKIWEMQGLTAPENLVEVLGELVVKGGKVQAVQREPGKNETGIVGFVIKVKLPNFPEGKQMVLVGHDRTHRDTPLGAMDFQSGSALKEIMDYATREGFPPIYIAETSGAKMALPEELIPRRGDDLRLRWDEAQKKIYLNREDVDSLLAHWKMGSLEEIMLGQWLDVGGESRFYPTDLLKGGINVESLRGSAKSAGAFARAAADIPTLAMLLAEGGIATGIGLYNLRLCRTLRGQRGNGNGKDSFIILTGFEAINKMFNAELFPDQAALGGSKRMLAEGMSTHLVSSEAQGMLEALKVLDQNPAIPDIRRTMPLPGLPVSPERVAIQQKGTGRDIQIAIRASQQRIKQIANEKKLPYPPGVYDTRDELAAFVDPGSFVSVPTKTHHAVLGFGTKDGYPVALWGIQMLPEFDLDESGRLKIINGVPQVKPGMTLPAEAAGEIASFLESLPPWMAILSDPAASGYDPRTVAASGEHGARLASAQTLHSAPQTSWVGPNKRVLGGMYVTIGEDLSRDGKIKLFADPTSTVAVLDPKGWKGIGFYKNHVLNVARLLQQRDGLQKDEAQKIATAMVDQVITMMSTIRRAETAGAISEIVAADKIGVFMSQKVREWYEGAEFRRLYASTLEQPS